MEISDQVKEFINRHAYAIDDNQWQSIYESDGYSELTPRDCGAFSYLINKAGINPLDYMSYVPWYYMYATDITKLNLPRNIIEIDDAAFQHCADLTRAFIPDSVKAIGKSAFSDCTSLIDITIPDSVISIGEWAFYHCTDLKNVILGNNVTSISEYTFSGCLELTSIIIGKHVTEIDKFAFGSCKNLISINYQSTRAQWGAIDKAQYWDMNAGDYIIHCTDGDIEKT